MRRSRGKPSVVRAIDTNIFVRFLTKDHARESEAARVVIEGGDVFVPTTVCLESERVLRSAYGLSAGQIAEKLRALAGLPGVAVEEPSGLAAELNWLHDGLDFADALHFAKSEGCSAFLTFDRKLAKAAKTRSVIPIEAP